MRRVFQIENTNDRVWTGDFEDNFFVLEVNIKTFRLNFYLIFMLIVYYLFGLNCV